MNNKLANYVPEQFAIETAVKTDKKPKTKQSGRGRYNYKKTALKAAKELGYGKDVIDKIEAASDEGEISRIIHQARMNWR